VLVREHVHEAFMRGPEHVIELFHGYTYSAHPLACAAGLAALDLYEREDLFGRALRLEEKFGDAFQALRDLPNVQDIRTIGLVAAVDLAPIEGSPGLRGYRALEHAFHEAGMMVRVTADTMVATPPLIVSEAQIGELAAKFEQVIRAVA
jgi:beta-alanine--pyruvate transaminase